ncbi:MAG: MFS transporter [Spirochaetaceae bacterium]
MSNILENDNKIKNITVSYYIISSLYTFSASFIWGINTLFLLDSGLDILGVFIVNAIFAAGMSLFEIPTGVFADTKGRRYSFLVSTIVLFIGTAGYYFSSVLNGGILFFSIFSIVMGLGFTFYSGAVEAWIVDELDFRGYKGKLDTVFSKGASISGVAMILGTISGGLMGYINLSIPYIARAIALILLFIFAVFNMKEIGFTPLGNKESYFIHLKRLTKDSIKFGWKRKSVRLLIIVSFFHSIFMMWGFYASQPYFLDLLGSRDAVWVSGFIAAGIALAQISGNSLVGNLITKVKYRTTILITSGALLGLFSISIGLSKSFMMALISFFLLMFFWGIFAPIKQGYIHQLIPKEKRATVLSFDSLIGNTGGMIGQPGLGLISKLFSISLGYIVGSIALFSTVPFLIGIKKEKDDADKT